MTIKIKPPSREKLEKSGWELMPNTQVYRKIFNECMVFIRPPDNEFGYECWMVYYGAATPDDFITIANELKKIEEN